MPIENILNRLKEHTPPLAPTEIWDSELEERIKRLDASQFAASEPDCYIGGRAVIAAFHLWNGSLDASHRIAQELETPLGSYWHGIMHRMEGDYSNANYWFARAGRQHIHALLQRFASELLAQREDEWQQLRHIGLRSKLEAIRYAPVWTPALFTAAVELCVQARAAAATPLLEAIQLEEIKLLTDFSYKRSAGGITLEPE